MGRRLFRVLLRLLPGEFRDGYASDAETTFRTELEATRALGRRAGLLRLWGATVADVVRVAPREHAAVLWRDLRVAARTMWARPAHTTAAVATMALGIGAAVTMFSIIDGVLLAPLAYHDAERLVAIGEARGDGRPGTTSYLSFLDLKARSRTVASLVAATQSTATFRGDGQEVERINAMRVSREYFPMVGVAPALGRTFTEQEDRPGVARQVVILSDGVWRRRFGADPAVIDRTVTINDLPHVVVGVMPRGFDDLVATRLYNDAGVWLPLGYDPEASFSCRTCRHLRVFGRLAPGASVADAQAELTQVYTAMAAAHPADYTSPRATVTTIGDVLLGPVRPALLLLAGGVALLFLVAGANVASLLLLRASERSAEIAVRAALGVTRARLARQLLTEAVLLTSLGAIVGLLPAWAAVRLVAVAGPSELPRLATLSLDGRAVGVAVVLALAGGLVFGLAPLRHLWGDASADALRGAGRRSGGAGVWRSRAVLIATNVAMAAVLLAASGVLVRSVRQLLNVAPGVAAEQVLTMRLWAGGTRFRDGDSAQQIRTAVAFYDEVLARARALPGVTSAAAVTVLPLSGDRDGIAFHIVGRMTANPADAPSADRFAVTPGYFATLGIPLVRGRLLDARDAAGAPAAVVINADGARTLFDGQDPLGRQVILGSPAGLPRTIVGIVGDVRHRGLDRQAGPQVYVPNGQWAWAETLMTLVVRTAGDPLAVAAAVRGGVRDVDPAQPVTDVRRYADVVAATAATRRFVAAALASFAALALSLAAVGLYGALSVTVAQRRLEIGIRLALGARAGTIRRMVFVSGLRPVALGLVAGLAAALLVVRAMSSLLFNVRPADPATFVAAAAMLVATGLVACAAPAWRASRLDAARALRAE